MKYAYALFCINRRADDGRHNLGLVEASGHDEALGKAYRVAHRLFPPWAGWEVRSVLIQPTDEPAVEPEDAVLRPPLGGR
jgi:hypothetical protein